MPRFLKPSTVPHSMHCRCFTAAGALVVMMLCGVCTAGDSAWQGDEAGYREIVAPFFHDHCIACHGAEAEEAGLHLDRDLPNDFLNLAAKGHWGEVVNVLNRHEMPPESQPQPDAQRVARVVDWITEQMVRAEHLRRDSAIVLRRLNRNEYRNTIRDLTGVDFDVSGFPMDPAAAGFDNIGAALTLSPLLLELYFDAARKILDSALVDGQRAPTLKWRFDPASGDSDSNRVVYDGQRVIVNGGKNRVENGFKVMHHPSWDRKLNARDFQLPHPGEYIIRIRAAGVVPDREQVVASASEALQRRLEDQIKKNPERENGHREELQRNLEHFRTDPMYDYGPPRLKLSRDLGGQPLVIGEFDVDAPLGEPGIYEVRTRMTTEKAGLTIEYAYSIPQELENFWMQGNDDFARPELWVDWFEIDGPVHDDWPPRGQQMILGELAAEVEANAQPDRHRVEQVVARFMTRAFRRPVTGAEVALKMDLYDQVRPHTESFLSAIKIPLIATLVSPEFLYLNEPSEPTAAQDREHIPRTINDYELASRLSYFLWSSMPDEELSDLAARGLLQRSDILTAQVDRLLADPKSTAFVQNFAGQWLGLRDVGANPPAADLFPRYDRHLETSIVQESESFFAEILRSDLSVMNFVRSDFVVINERLARFYGIPDVRGDHFRPVPVPDGITRGGVVTQASILTITSNGTRTSPVTRGTWVMRNLLGIDPGLPVAGAGEIAPKVPGIDKATVRQRLEIHRSLPQCARCHDKIDPLGFALENFNAAGQWRDREGFGYKGRIGGNDPPIDASAKLPDGTEFVGVRGLQQVLMDKQDLFLRCLAGKMWTYALGRELGVADQVHVRSAVEEMQSQDLTLRALIRYIAGSEPFRTK